MKTNTIIKLFLIAFIICLGGRYVLQGKVKNITLKKGDKAPSIILFNLKDKFFKSKKHFKKSIILLNFWSTYCVPCKKEIPELIKMSEEFKDKNITMLFISLDKEGRKKVMLFLKENKFNIPETNVLLDIYKMTAKKYGVTKLPSLFIINKKGKIEYSCVGYKESNLKNIEKTLKKLTKSK